MNAAAAGRLDLGGGLTVTRLGFGAMRVAGKSWGEPDDRQAAVALLRRVVELGVELIDTAYSYGGGVSERLIAEALHPYPPELVIATKGGMIRTGAHEVTHDGRPEHLRAACEESLRRLRLERIALYQLHTVDSNVPLEESVGALADLRAEGKIERVGLSNVTVEQLERAERIVSIVSVQNRYSLFDREHEDVLQACEQRRIAFLPYFPLGGGLLRATDEELRQYPDARPVRARVERVARARGVTPNQVVLAWLLRRSAALPIPGTSSVAHLEENVAAAELRLTDEEAARLEE